MTYIIVFRRVNGAKGDIDVHRGGPHEISCWDTFADAERFASKRKWLVKAGYQIVPVEIP